MIIDIVVKSLSHITTTKEEAVGLEAHAYLIIQLSRDLSGSQWLKYDQRFREWAAAKDIHRCGELNLTIYGQCLAAHFPIIPAVPTQTSSSRNTKLHPMCVIVGMMASYVTVLCVASFTNVAYVGRCIELETVLAGLSVLRIY